MGYTWTDETLDSDDDIRTFHVSELRTNLNNERNRRSMTQFSWTDDPLDSDTKIKTVHINELRNGCDTTPVNTGCSAEKGSYYSDNDSTVYSDKDATIHSDENTGINSGRDVTVYNGRDGSYHNGFDSDQCGTDYGGDDSDKNSGIHNVG